MKKKPPRKAAAPPALSPKELEREQTRRALKRAVAREREIRLLTRQLERALLLADRGLRVLIDGLVPRAAFSGAPASTRDEREPAGV